MGFDLSSFVEMQKTVMEQIKAVFQSIGISLDLEKIDVSPADEPDAIDLIYRIRCRDKILCEEMKKELEARYGGGGERGEEKEEE